MTVRFNRFGAEITVVVDSAEEVLDGVSLIGCTGSASGTLDKEFIARLQRSLGRSIQARMENKRRAKSEARNFANLDDLFD